MSTTCEKCVFSKSAQQGCTFSCAYTAKIYKRLIKSSNQLRSKFFFLPLTMQVEAAPETIHQNQTASTLQGRSCCLVFSKSAEKKKPGGPDTLQSGGILRLCLHRPQPYRNIRVLQNPFRQNTLMRHRRADCVCRISADKKKQNSI